MLFLSKKSRLSKITANELLLIGPKLPLPGPKNILTIFHIAINVNGNLDAVNGNLGPVKGNLSVMKKTFFVGIICKFFYFNFNEQIALFSTKCLLGGCLSQDVINQTLSHSKYPKTNYAMVLLSH